MLANTDVCYCCFYYDQMAVLRPHCCYDFCDQAEMLQPHLIGPDPAAQTFCSERIDTCSNDLYRHNDSTIWCPRVKNSCAILLSSNPGENTRLVLYGFLCHLANLVLYAICMEIRTKRFEGNTSYNLMRFIKTSFKLHYFLLLY